MILLVSLLAFALVGSLAALTGCSAPKSDEQVIRASLVDDLDRIKNLDDTFINELSESVNVSQLTMYGIDGADFMKAYLDGFDYAIDSVTVDGDTAQAQVTFTCKSYQGYQAALQEAVSQRVQNPDELAGKSDEEINKEISDIVIGSLANVELAATEPITISYTKVDSEWVPSSSTAGDIAAALITN